MIFSQQQSTSCSPSTRSLTKDYKRGLLSLRAFHSTEEVDVDIPHFSLRSDERSSSDQSCDTVIQLDSEGLVQSRTTSRLAQPEFVPIIPSMHPNKADMDDPEFTALLQELLRIPQLQAERKDEENLQGNSEVRKTDMKGRECLKCDTFAELQERLGCIDGSEATMEALKSSAKGLLVNIAAGEVQPVKEKGRQTFSESPQTSLSQGQGCQASVSEKQTDGAFPGDSFQREDSGLYDCEECSTNSSGEELLNQTLHRTCRSEARKHESARPNSQKVDANSQGSSLTNQNAAKKESPEAADWFKADKRTSPVGKSSPISPSSASSCSASHSMATGIILEDALTHRPREILEEMKATITVTVQQPLDLKGQDELVFSMVEEVTISGALKRGRAGGNIICIRDGVQSLGHVQGSVGSQPIRIISNVGDETVPAGSSDIDKSSVVQAHAKETNPEQPHCPPRKEKRYLPSFINPMLMNTDVEFELDKPEKQESSLDSLTPQTGLGGVPVKGTEEKKVPEERTQMAKKSEVCDSPLSQVCHDSVMLGHFGLSSKPVEKAGGKRPRGTDNNHPREREHAFPSKPPRISEEGEICSRHVRDDPKRIGPPPGCPETPYASIKTGSLPRAWHNASHQDINRGGYTADVHRDPRGLTSSTPCSPDVTLKRRQRMQHSAVNHGVLVSRQHVKGELSRQSVETLYETSGLRGNMGGRLKSPTEDRLFNVKLEQLATRSNSLGRMPREFPSLGRDSSSTSMSSKGSSKESTEGAFNRGLKGLKEGDYTSPRASMSPRKNRPEHSYHFFPFDETVAQPANRAHPKLSAVGKLKMACGPKVRRLSTPSIKNLSLTRKNLQPSLNRSESLSPESKSVSFERTSSFLSSSPPRSFRSISRTPSQSSTSSSTKSAIQGFVNGRISELLKERPVSPISAGLDQIPALPSPYSRVTSPRMADRSSGHASDTTSVLSGDLPPAMGKTSLHFSGRSNMVSGGYDSRVREGESTGSSASTRNSTSDRNASLLSVARSSRSSRRRGHACKIPGKNGLL